MVNDELLTVKQLAERLKLHPETVRTWLRTGRLRGRRMSDRMGWRVPEAELRRFIAEELMPDATAPEAGSE